MLASHDVRLLKAHQLDALREVASIGAGHAATALSTMTGRAIMIAVPTISMERLEDVPSHVVGTTGEPVVAILLRMLGDLTGRALFVLSEPTACRLAELLMHRTRGSSVTIGALERSALMECGNILCGSYLNALAGFMELLLLPSPPTLAVDAAGAVLSPAFLQMGEGRDMAICVESEFQVRDEEQSLRGYFLLLPDGASLQRILRALRAD